MVGSLFFATAIVIPNPNKIDADATVARNVVSDGYFMFLTLLWKRGTHVEFFSTDPEHDRQMSLCWAVLWQHRCQLHSLRAHADESM